MQGHMPGFRVLFRWKVSLATNTTTAVGSFSAPTTSCGSSTGENANPQNRQVKTNLRGKTLRMNGTARSPRTTRTAHASGRSDTATRSGSPSTRRHGRLWETENGAECNDEINLIVKGGNFGWGAQRELRNGTAPQEYEQQWSDAAASSQDVLPKPDRDHGGGVLHRCGLGASRERDLVFGDWNTGSIRAVNLNAHSEGVLGRSEDPDRDWE
jgi:hypothetical protein